MSDGQNITLSNAVVYGNVIIAGKNVQLGPNPHTPGEPPGKKRIFLSHAHKDDKAFARQLADQLEEEFDVWVDLVKMPSRGHPFPNELKEALAACDRYVYIAGPAALHSEWVQYELAHALAWCKAITPVLRLGSWAAVGPEALRARALTYIEMRAGERPASEALDHLRRVLREDERPPGPLHAADPMPQPPPGALP
ncbi:MAG: toll/interleukin-1 receptor domain-containing protein, partial [Chloroflexi bacterium]|nr:toll/interleukin-1 receptor domain-containing protein [Chloroflexota bacterium]